MANLTNYNNKKLEWFDSEREILKISDIVGKRLTIKNYGFIKTKNGRRCVLEVAEFPQNVIFANDIMAEKFEELDADGMHSAACDGTTAFVIESKTSESGRNYYMMLFVE